jgi:hypothetical protein
MESVIKLLVVTNSWLYTLMLLLLLCVSILAWRRTRQWPFAVFAVALALPVLASIAMWIYALVKSAGCPPDQMRNMRMLLLKHRFIVSQGVNLVTFSLLLVGGLGLLTRLPEARREP